MLNTNSSLSSAPASADALSPRMRSTLHHKPHRPHVVGGGRNHHRNPSSGKNVNKLPRFQLPETTGRHHQRKKSAPATPIASPKGQSHIRWEEGAHEQRPGSMKRNYSTPALRRNTSGIQKKINPADRPHTSSERKKSVGFELGEYEPDDAEWEDTTQSPESTRRNSVAPSNPSLENQQVLVDPLTFVKRPYPQMPRATSLPDSITSRLAREQADAEEEAEEEAAAAAEAASSHVETSDIASRLLSPSLSAKAPPAMSSISAMAKSSDAAHRTNSSLSLAGKDGGSRRNYSTTNLGTASVPSSHTQATSSSMEGGVSRFIPSNRAGQNASSRTDSDPNTPSSFLPHYHPQTPPSPNRGAGKATTSSPAHPSRAENSRTNQKMWLQRTATLNNSPPDSHGVSNAVPPSAIDSTYMANNNARAGGGFDTGRATNGSARAGVPGQDSETRQIRKAYEKAALELSVVRRFQSPAGDSFNRLRAVAGASKALGLSLEQRSALGKPTKSAPSLPLLQQGRHPNRLGLSSESKSQLPDPHSSAPEDPASQSESTDTATTKVSHPSHRILSTSDEGVQGPPGENDSEDYPPVSEADMMIRRMWDSREVATSG
ncbi:hypothetical protein N7470_004301 [Penicillium chermesinum]|nr:hypothetical protein N7470_004301 [Penicillium chermesinum]